MIESTDIDDWYWFANYKKLTIMDYLVDKMKLGIVLDIVANVHNLMQNHTLKNN